ncbi:FtsW/RodA/SpoVE family cell cycle protein [Corynebacterium imitans]|uniref:FtsW/RodA/SpoVE family cell cycle protein n=1 Tax=Corynebacterium imitans TaxID=156978 RepID=UPI00254DAFEC|nr:FtsW/RodA/SpoVE family cell cycle protein [Corynebacterium imitans]MDK8305749.1 FtsW/RodA/SpoVE family cell cycle protein [Corynebacterium imitans]MDK8636785.1 FtsW/RodA/SpoVE family cell cycle protein [Corynebacterium imitans]MDK8772400.1 FtsW/RodA/SpoVE family cell cycle protein [Corynebacterium imitans]
MTVTRDGHPAARTARRNDRAQRPVSRLGAASRRVEDFLDARPLIDYTMIRSVVFVLAGLGLVMVLSSSMAMSYFEAASPWKTAARQGLMVVMGLVAFLAALQMPLRWLRSINAVMLLVSYVLLVLVLPFGTGGDEVGSQSWLALGPLRVQPSEIARLTFAIWGAQEVARKGIRFKWDSGAAFYLVGIAGFLLIAAQKDMGMALSFALIMGLIMFFAGVTRTVLFSFGLIGLVMLLFTFLSGSFRSDRFHVYFDALFGKFDDTRGIAFQSHQGFLSLADGGLFGVGLGQSRAKWFYLPEAKNDFIFAIIGEELGLWGGALVIGLFAALGYFGLRAARRAATQEQRMIAASLTAAVVVQALINISYVVGLLPVTGIQLPMISAGGSSAVVTFGAMGVLASIARHEPDAVSAMQNYGRPRFDRVFRIPEPEPVLTTQPERRVRAAAAPQPERRPHKQRVMRGRRVVHASEREARFGTPVTARGERTRQMGRTPGHARVARPDRTAGRRQASSPRSRQRPRYDEPRNRRAG